MAYNNPIQKKESACKQLKSETGKPSGLMMEGSVNHMSMLHQEEGPSKRTQRIREKREKLDNKFLDGEMSEEKYARKEARTRKKLEKSKAKDKESALEMSPYKMDSALHNNDPYSRAAANDKVFADAKKSKYSRSNPKHAGSNFFPPTNPKAKKDLVKGKTADEDLASYFYDSDQDGDNVFRDYNQDGTMAGRFITNLFK